MEMIIGRKELRQSKMNSIKERPLRFLCFCMLTPLGIMACFMPGFHLRDWFKYMFQTKEQSELFNEDYDARCAAAKTAQELKTLAYLKAKYEKERS